jgi:hypothetical protein
MTKPCTEVAGRRRQILKLFQRPLDDGCRYREWKIMNRIFLLFLVVSRVGCNYLTFLHPIVEPQSAERYEEIFGVYQAKHPENEKTSWLHIGFQKDGLPDGLHKFVWVSHTAPKANDQRLIVSEYLGFVYKNGESYIIQIPYTKECGDKQASVIE